MTLWENKVRMPSVFVISSLLKNPYLVTEIINFIEEIRQQKHENRLCLLIAQILHHRLFLSKFQYIPESFLVSYYQTAIMYSSRLLYNMVLTHLGWIVREATYVNEFIAWILPTSKRCF